MPTSNDNQDYGKSDEKNKEKNTGPVTGDNKLTSDDLKGKKVDPDLDNEKDKPLEQKK
ncbi:MAG: hypothetical protein JWQ09_3414 [Segetibacter sp.]|nr:hypothetical protein [Segetibacter sp.]